MHKGWRVFLPPERYIIHNFRPLECFEDYMFTDIEEDTVISMWHKPVTKANI